MKKVAVIGGSGMVASRFIDLSSNKIDTTSLDENSLDITDRSSVNRYFSTNKFDAIVNFAAYTNVDGAETQKGDETGSVWKINVEGPKNLVEVSEKENIFLVHISTDFVFPGNDKYPGPYDEKDKLPTSSDGIGWYGWTKLQAEVLISGSGVNSAIIRYGYPFRASKYDKKLDWARNILKLYKEHNLYPLFNDQIYSILFIDDLADPLIKIIENKFTGIFHIASNNTTTPYEAGKYLLEGYFKSKDINIKEASMIEFMKNSQKAPRPRLTEKKLGITFNTWKYMLDKFLNQYGK
jgi:dTDP-4-dehydrorhamnose reductase